MWDKLRRLLWQLLATAKAAVLPAAAVYALLLLILALLHGGPEFLRSGNTALKHFILLLIVYVICAAVRAFTERDQLRRSFSRPDAALIGQAFSGFSRRDRLFSSGMQLCAKGDYAGALEQFLALGDFEMSTEETGVCAFYTGRCYQLLNEPQNAAYFFQRARENRFSKAHALLFEARSCEKTGDFDRALTLFIELLELPAPEDFDFLNTDIGFLFIRQDRPRDAAEWFRKSIEAGQCYAYALSGMAMAALLSGRYKQAMQFRVQALLNQLENPEQFKIMFDTTRDALMEQHPDWDWSAPAEPPRTDAEEAS